MQGTLHNAKMCCGSDRQMNTLSNFENNSVKSSIIVISDVVPVKEDKRKQGRWKMEIVEKLITGRNGGVSCEMVN